MFLNGYVEKYITKCDETNNAFRNDYLDILGWLSERNILPVMEELFVIMDLDVLNF